MLCESVAGRESEEERKRLSRSASSTRLLTFARSHLTSLQRDLSSVTCSYAPSTIQPILSKLERFRVLRGFECSLGRSQRDEQAEPLLISYQHKMKLTTTTLHAGNLHCPSCVTAITLILSSEPLNLNAETISVSLLTGLVTFTHPPSLLGKCRRALLDAGYDIDDPSAHGPRSHRPTSAKWFESKARRERKVAQEEEAERRRYQAHLQSCLACRGSAPTDKGKAKEFVVQVAASGDRKTTLVVSGMTCASCVGAVNRIFESDPRVRTAEVTLLPGRAVVHHDPQITDNDLVEMLEDAGFEGEVVESVSVQGAEKDDGWTETKFVVEGMTCS